MPEKKMEITPWCVKHWNTVEKTKGVNGIAASVELMNTFLEIVKRDGNVPRDAAAMNAELERRGPVCCLLSRKDFAELLERAKIGVEEKFN